MGVKDEIDFETDFHCHGGRERLSTKDMCARACSFRRRCDAAGARVPGRLRRRGSGKPGAGGSGGNPGGGGSGNGAVAAATAAMRASAFSRSELLAAFGTCAAERIRDFRDRAAALDAAVTAYVATPDDTTRAAARQAFRDAMDSWQVIDIMQFGPTGPTCVIGGKDFRDNIYGWPHVDRCGVEEAIVARSYEAANFEGGAVRQRPRAGRGRVPAVLRRGGHRVRRRLAGKGGVADADRGGPRRAQARLRRCGRRRMCWRARPRSTQAWDPAQMNFVQTMRIGRAGQCRLPDAAGGDRNRRASRCSTSIRWSRTGSSRCRSTPCCAGSACLRIALRGPLEGEHPRQPGRPAPRSWRAAAPTTPGWGSTICWPMSAPTALADTLRTQAIAGAGGAGRDRGARPRTGAGGRQRVGRRAARRDRARSPPRSRRSSTRRSTSSRRSSRPTMTDAGRASRRQRLWCGAGARRATSPRSPRSAIALGRDRA